MNKETKSFIEEDYTKISLSSLSPFPEDIEIKINDVIEKANFYIKKREFELLISFLEQSVPNFLNVKFNLHFTLLFFCLIELIRKEEDNDYIQKFFQNRILDIFSKNPFFLKQKYENISLIINNSKFLKARGFLIKYETKLSELLKRLVVELRNFFSGIKFVDKENYKDFFTADQKFQKVFINVSSLENGVSKDFDHEIACDIKQEIFCFNQGKTYENNCICNIIIKIANFIKFSKNYQIFQSTAPHIEADEQKLNNSQKNFEKEKANFKKYLEENTTLSTKTESTSYSRKKSNRSEMEIPFLKDFNQKLIKREYIDKKIIRKFRKYLKKEWSVIQKEMNNKEFWNRFTKENLLPPFKYYDGEAKNTHEFKTFSIKFMIWFFSIRDSKKLYTQFIIKNGESIYKSFIESIDKNEKKIDFEKFSKDLQIYIFDMPKIYSSSINEEQMPPLTPNEEGILIDGLFGPELNHKSKDNFLSSYRRRPKNGSSDEERNQNKLNDMFHNSFSDLNISNDSGNDSRNNEE